jgi:amino acid transporter
MLMLAFVFQTLSRRKPELDAGIYAYAKAGFGEYPDFVSAVGYWIGCCLADVACLALIKATLGHFFRFSVTGRHPPRSLVGRAFPDPARTAVFLCAASAVNAEPRDSVERAQRLDTDAIRDDVRINRLQIPQHR